MKYFTNDIYILTFRGKYCQEKHTIVRDILYLTIYQNGIHIKR